MVTNFFFPEVAKKWCLTWENNILPGWMVAVAQILTWKIFLSKRTNWNENRINQRTRRFLFEATFSFIFQSMGTLTMWIYVFLVFRLKLKNVHVQRLLLSSAFLNSKHVSNAISMWSIFFFLKYSRFEKAIVVNDWTISVFRVNIMHNPHW